MSCLENDKIKENLWERFADLYDQGLGEHANSWGEDCCILSMLSEIEGTCLEEYISLGQLEDLFDRLWDEDCEHFSMDMFGFLTKKYHDQIKKIKVFGDIGGSLCQNFNK